jgi:hypothetical protein
MTCALQNSFLGFLVIRIVRQWKLYRLSVLGWNTSVFDMHSILFFFGHFWWWVKLIGLIFWGWGIVQGRKNSRVDPSHICNFEKSSLAFKCVNANVRGRIPKFRGSSRLEGSGQILNLPSLWRFLLATKLLPEVWSSLWPSSWWGCSSFCANLMCGMTTTEATRHSRK